MSAPSRMCSISAALASSSSAGDRFFLGMAASFGGFARRGHSACHWPLHLPRGRMPKLIGILYEHPEWFRPLLAELDRRGLPYEPILAHEHQFDPSASESPYGLVVNRMSPSSYLR